MQKISSYLYPNRIELLANLAGFTVEYTNVYQRIVKIYNGIDNTVEFDIKNADQKRINLDTLTNIELNVMDASGYALPNSPYTVDPLDQTSYKGLASVTIPKEDLSELKDQYLTFSVTAIKDGNDIMLYGDSRFGAVGRFELVGTVMPVSKKSRVFNTFTAEIDLKGHPTFHSSAIPTTSYEAVKTETLSVDVKLSGFTGSVWLEAIKQSTINTEAFKSAKIIDSNSFDEFSGVWTPTVNSSTDIPIEDYKYFRISYTTPLNNGMGASFIVTQENDLYQVEVKSGGTGYAIGSKLKVLGSVLGGTDIINDLIITVTGIDGTSTGYPSSYSVSSISSVTVSGASVNSSNTYTVTGTNITGTVDKVTVS